MNKIKFFGVHCLLLLVSASLAFAGNVAVTKKKVLKDSGDYSETTETDWEFKIVSATYTLENEDGSSGSLTTSFTAGISVIGADIEGEIANSTGVSRNRISGVQETKEWVKGDVRVSPPDTPVTTTTPAGTTYKHQKVNKWNLNTSMDQYNNAAFSKYITAAPKNTKNGTATELEASTGKYAKTKFKLQFYTWDTQYEITYCP